MAHTLQLRAESLEPIDMIGASEVEQIQKNIILSSPIQGGENIYGTGNGETSRPSSIYYNRTTSWCCVAGLPAMETGGEDRFERDKQVRVRNPAGWMVVCSHEASAPQCGTSSPAAGSLIIITPDRMIMSEPMAGFWGIVT
jgi:hypothetical protein